MTSEMVQTANQPMGQLDFQSLRQQATAIVSEAQLEKDKWRLVGVPHAITRVTYRPGVKTKEGLRDYVSIEAVVADDETLYREIVRGRVPNVDTVEALTVKPNEKVIYNDGSTGVRRQLTAMFHNLGIITVPNVTTDMAAFDTPYFEWEAFTQTGEMNGDKETDARSGHWRGGGAEGSVRRCSTPARR